MVIMTFPNRSHCRGGGASSKMVVVGGGGAPRKKGGAPIESENIIFVGYRPDTPTL